MKFKTILAIMLLTGLAGITKETKCNVTIILPQGSTFSQNYAPGGPAIGFCNDTQCTSIDHFYDYTYAEDKITVPLHNRTRLRVKFKDSNNILYQWERDVLDGKIYTITINACTKVPDPDTQTAK